MDNEENISLDKLFIEDGKKVVGLLDTTDFKPSAALWFYFKEQKIWRLLIASPNFNDLPAQDRYRKFIGIFNQATFHRIKLENIALLGSADPLISLFKIAVVTGPDSLSEFRFTANTINGSFIDDALIYRLT